MLIVNVYQHLLDCIALQCREGQKHRDTKPRVLENSLACCRATYWAFELEEMVSSSLWRKHEFRHMYPLKELEGQDNDPLLAEHCDLFHNLLSCRATSLSSTYTLPPMRWNAVLLSNPQEAAAARDTGAFGTETSSLTTPTCCMCPQAMSG